MNLHVPVDRDALQSGHGDLCVLVDLCVWWTVHTEALACFRGWRAQSALHVRCLSLGGSCSLSQVVTTSEPPRESTPGSVVLESTCQSGFIFFYIFYFIVDYQNILKGLAG